MKATSILIGLPLLCLACGGSTTDDGGSAATPNDGPLAKEVVGVHSLSPDDRYTTPEHYLTEEFVRSNFKLEESVELTETAEKDGIHYQWGSNEVGFTFGHYRPFPTLYAAEAAFDEQYQPKLVEEMNAMPKKPYSNGGPASQGLANEWPSQPETPGPKKEAAAVVDDTASAVSGIVAAAVMKAPPTETSGKFQSVDGVGDKAVWEPAKHTLHVLYNNNIVSVQVKTKDSPAGQQQRAAAIANVVLTEITE